MQLYTKILIGLVLGIILGMMANLFGLEWLRQGLFFVEPVGQAFIKLITMVVIPLVAASLFVGTASLGDLRKLGRIGSKTVGFFLGTTAAAVILGLLLSQVITPGSGITAETRDSLSAGFEDAAEGRLEMAAEAPSVGETLMGIIPSNPIGAAAAGELLPLIFFVILFGAATSTLGESRRTPVVDFFQGVNDAVMVIIRWIMLLAPYAVFALVGPIAARFGMDIMQALLVYVLTIALGMAILAFGLYATLVKVLARLNPVDFFRKIAAPALVALSTSSSSATLPVSMETAEKRLGISKGVTSFVLPLGATINMAGTALYQAVSVMFIAQLYGIELGVGQQLTIVLTATLASIGTAGVPAAGIIILILVLQSVGMGAQAGAGIALLLGIDRIPDMLRTTCNVMGDLVAASFVARSEGESLEPPPPGMEEESGRDPARVLAGKA
jgi:Na+/H+-dicarboxylate symporter